MPQFLLYCRYLLFSRERLCFLHPLLKARINDQTIGIGPGREVRFATPGADDELVYIVEKPSGEQEMLAPQEFRQRIEQVFKKR